MRMPAATAPAEPRVARPRSRLGTRLAVVLMPLVLIPVMLMGGAAYLRTRTILETQARSQLTALTVAQLETVREWSRRRELQLRLGSQRTEVVGALDTLMAADAGSPDFVSARQMLRTSLAELMVRSDETLFGDLVFVRLPDGLVVGATSPDLEGQTLASVRDGKVSTNGLVTTPAYNHALLPPGHVALLPPLPILPEAGASPAGL